MSALLASCGNNVHELKRRALAGTDGACPPLLAIPELLNPPKKQISPTLEDDNPRACGQPRGRYPDRSSGAPWRAGRPLPFADHSANIWPGKHRFAIDLRRRSRSLRPARTAIRPVRLLTDSCGTWPNRGDRLRRRSISNRSRRPTTVYSRLTYARLRP